MSEYFKVSFLAAAVNALQGMIGRAGTQSERSIDGVQHRIAVLRVKEGRIIEQSARLNGC